MGVKSLIKGPLHREVVAAATNRLPFHYVQALGDLLAVGIWVVTDWRLPEVLVS